MTTINVYSHSKIQTTPILPFLLSKSEYNISPIYRISSAVQFPILHASKIRLVGAVYAFTSRLNTKVVQVPQRLCLMPTINHIVSTKVKFT